jgi:hypothetical protein
LSEKDKTSLIKEDLIDEQQKVVTIKVAEKPEGEKENNVRFIKPRLLHREYDDEDESREVRTFLVSFLVFFTDSLKLERLERLDCDVSDSSNL